jgi:transcriptional regulator with XRE-family HTH domain
MVDKFVNGVKTRSGDERLTIIGERIKSIRKSKGLTQGQVAELMGTATTVISRLERGTLNPTIMNFMGLCSALEVDPSELLHGLRRMRTKGDSNDGDNFI